MPIPPEFLEKLSVNPNYTHVPFPVSKIISTRWNESTLDVSWSSNGEILNHLIGTSTSHRISVNQSRKKKINMYTYNI